MVALHLCFTGKYWVVCLVVYYLWVYLWVMSWMVSGGSWCGYCTYLLVRYVLWLKISICRVSSGSMFLAIGQSNDWNTANAANTANTQLLWRNAMVYRIYQGFQKHCNCNIWLQQSIIDGKWVMHWKHQLDICSMYCIYHFLCNYE